MPGVKGVRRVAVATVLAMLLLPWRPALAWGPDGHRVIAVLADRVLQQSMPAVHGKIKALLATDKDNRWTKNDIAGEATWPDVLREKSQEARFATTGWHYTRFDFASPDLNRACYGRPALPPGYPADRGPPENCSVDKLLQFQKELRDPATPAAERLDALRFVLNLVGDLHQPLYNIDHDDRGGRCVAVQVGQGKAPASLLHYWDVVLAGEVIGRDPGRAAARLSAGLSREKVQQWTAGSPEQWARESYDVAKGVAYAFVGQQPAGKYALTDSDSKECGLADLYRLGVDYETKGLAAVRDQLAKAGLRLALILRDGFASDEGRDRHDSGRTK